MKTATERFLRYITFDTQSQDDCEQVPSTQKQHLLAKELAKELEEIGAQEVRYDSEHCYVYATIPATDPEAEAKKLPTLGFIAHMDTSDAISGENVKARLIENYDGTDVVLNEELGVVMKTKDYPHLLDNKGKTLIVTDGTTLLGADDKAGVAEIMAMAEYLLEHREILHGKIRIGFTPDEEVGHGVSFFDVEGFGCDWAYTIDGGAIGEIEYENFNAAAAKVKINGNSIHPGTAKGKMINSQLVAMELQEMLPAFENPAYTEGYEGFYHLTDMTGTVEETVMNYIIRDHDRAKFEAKKEFFGKVVDHLNAKYGAGTVNATVKDTYYNMVELIKPHIHLIDNAVAAMREHGVEPIIMPIRGGTDGAMLSYKGLPCPNLCTGGYNFHGKFEYITVEALEKIAQILVSIVKIYDKPVG
ncbi:MAG: peptidase T [Lachnospiraceae bacterium]|nr:peptidase T [Lachnospiraceae bacterium]